MTTQAPIYQASDLNEKLMSESKAKGSKIANPNTGKLSYGHVPENKNGIPSGPIYLKLGIIGHGKWRKGGCGARHVWEKHNRDLNILTPDETPQVIADILIFGVNVLADLNASHSSHRAIALNTSIGIVVLEHYKEQGGEDAYQIVTAYGKRNATGTVIGTLESPKD